jgi:hypothetical protein
MTDTTTKVREHYGAMGLTDRIKSALATLAPEGQTLTVVQLAPLDQFHTRGIPRDRRIGNRRRARVLEHLGDAAVRALIGGSPESANRTHQCSKAFQRVSSNYLLSFHVLAHSLTQRETQLFYFQAIPHSLPQNSGVVVPLRLRFLLGRTLPTDPGVSPNASLFNLQLSIEDPDLVGTVSLLRGTSSAGHGTRITHHRAICRIHYLSQSLASDVLLEPEVRSANLPAGHSSVVSEFVGGGHDG